MDDKDDSLATTTTTSEPAAAAHGVDELARIIDSHLNPVAPTTRNKTPPVMGTTARAAKRRMDQEAAPSRLEGTDNLTQLYLNIQGASEQRSVPLAAAETSVDSQQSINTKRDVVEEQQQNATTTTTYDSPPRQTSPAAQQIITTITTTTTSVSNADGHDRTSSSSNDSPSVDHVLEQAVELQRLSQGTTTTSNAGRASAPDAMVIERTEQYQVFLDSANHEIRRTPSVSRTTLVPITKAGHATDLDEAQAQVERLTDDHQAIQQLTRALHEHTQATTTDSNRLPSTPKSIERLDSPLAAAAATPTTGKPSPFSVIDALISNPLGTGNDRSNSLSQTRYKDIVSNIRSPQWLQSLKATEKPKKTKKEKKVKEKKSKEKKGQKQQPQDEQALETTNLTNNSEQLASPSIEPVTTTSLERTPLIDPKDKKKATKKSKKDKKAAANDVGYQVIDAILGSPITIRLPESYLNKYKVSPPLVLSTPVAETLGRTTEKTTTTDNRTSPSAATAVVTDEKKNNTKENESILELARVVHELQLHHAAALVASTNTTPSSKVEAKKGQVVLQKVVEQNPLLTHGHSPPLLSSTPPVTTPPPPPSSTEVQSAPSASAEPPVFYRYMNEQGRIFAITSTPPSQLRDQAPMAVASSHVFRNTPDSVQRAPPVVYQERNISIDDERRHPLAQYEHRPTWQGEPKLPTTTTREDFESRDKRVPQLSDHQHPSSSHFRSIPVSYEGEANPRVSSAAATTRQYHYPNQQNVKLAWLPLSYPNEPTGYTSNPAAGYETDSTISERSANYRPYDYAPAERYYRPSHQSPTYYQDYRHYDRSPGPTYYPAPPPLPYTNSRGVSPEYGQPRNYLEIFRGGDFRETKPSEIYSLPLNDYSGPSPAGYQRHSRYDQYQSEKYGTNARRSIPSLQTHEPFGSNIPSSSLYTSSQYTHRSPPDHRPVQHSPPSAYATSSVRPSKSFDYRPLRTKLQREYRITPNLLVDEWDYPSASEKIHYSTATSTTNRSGVSSPDDVFLSNRTSTG